MMSLKAKRFYCGRWEISVVVERDYWEFGIVAGANTYERLFLKIALGTLQVWATWWRRW